MPGAEDADEGDFFRLPFPNDALRSSNGRLDLSGFPTPGPGVLGFDLVADYVEAIEQDRSGWGTYPTVTFRFSNMLDPASLKQDGLVNFVDVTEGSEEADLNWGWDWHYAGSRSAYVCESRLMIRRPMGAPLLPSHVYAVYLTTGVLGGDGSEVTRSPNLAAVLDADEPSDDRLAEVHAAYAPFRQYLADNNLDPESILTATVITAGSVRDTMAQLADLVEAEPTPTSTDWTRCEEGVTSPCSQRAEDAGRACGPEHAAYDEYHALVSLPIWQEGAAPYLASGGAVELDDPQRSEDVCLALTVPKGTMPDAGWPLVVYAHGTGGSYRSHVCEAVAAVLAEAPASDDGSLGLAVLGIDQVQHGPRRAESEEEPESLFFNSVNPAAARGNVLQGAADQLALARLAAELDVTVGSAEIRIDPDKILFFGHSQGATHGSLALPYSSTYRAAVLSGNGASIRESLVSKTSPVNIPALLPLAVGDPEAATEVVGYHPVLGLIQQWMDPADPLNYAHALVRAPIDPHPARHVFMTYGLGDTYSPPPTLQTFALAGGFVLVEGPGSEVDEFGGLTPQDAPLAGNWGGVTLGMRQYEPASDSDGHFVAFDVAEANEDIVRFFAMAAADETPAIGE